LSSNTTSSAALLEHAMPRGRHRRIGGLST
jgi:hypothetical protein